MKETEFKYFLDGKEVNRNDINWSRTMTITPKFENEMHVKYLDLGHGTRHKAVKLPFIGEVYKDQEEADIERFVKFSERYIAGIDPIGDDVVVLETNYTTDTKIPSYEEIREVVYSNKSFWDKDNESLKGVKHNKHKAPLSILFTQFPKALEAISKCSDYGHQKYKETDKDYLNFKRVEGGSKTYADAGLRHRLEVGLDSESTLPHQYHVAWNALAELQLWIEENEK